MFEQYPDIAALGAMASGLNGEHAVSRLLADVAASGDPRSTAPDGSPLASWIAMMEAILCRRGADRMRSDAEQAMSGLSLRSSFRGPATFLAGLGMLLQGDNDGADPVLATSAELCVSRGGAASRAAALAERAVIAIERDDWSAARQLSDEAVAVVTDAQLDLYVQSLLVHAVAARTAARAGDVQRARTEVTLAARVRPRCSIAIPWSAQSLLQLAHAYLAVADPAGARAVLRQVRDIVLASPELGVVSQQCTELGRVLDSINVSSVGASSLTAAELRLVPLLATHLSYRDIGERLHVSRNTIKSEAMSVFRKLGVTSRREAVETAGQIGLLGL
jgi:LuxR family transcriptional regulator, maltose regulon positive regulatory protein